MGVVLIEAGIRDTLGAAEYSVAERITGNAVCSICACSAANETGRTTVVCGDSVESRRTG